MSTVAALYVQAGGAYFGLPDVDPWDDARDARLYDGPHPVVAHPPCSRWCRLAKMVEHSHGHRVGDDGGCFASALESVRRWGGVLEHPALSLAWAYHDLNPPTFGSGWIRADAVGWTCYVEQRRYGAASRKATWLYAVVPDPPTLRWGRVPDGVKGEVGWRCNRHVRMDGRRRLGAREASATPPEFREALLAMARSVYVGRTGST